MSHTIVAHPPDPALFKSVYVGGLDCYWMTDPTIAPTFVGASFRLIDDAWTLTDVCVDLVPETAVYVMPSLIPTQVSSLLRALAKMFRQGTKRYPGREPQ